MQEQSKTKSTTLARRSFLRRMGAGVGGASLVRMLDTTFHSTGVAGADDRPDERRAQYMLRRILPLWNPKEIIAETLAFCETAKIGEVIWKVDVTAFSHGFTPHSIIRKYLPWLAEARENSRPRGIRFSINPWVTLGHMDMGIYPAGPPEGFQWRVMSGGGLMNERACPLSAGWREWFLEAFRLFATTQPDKLWVEDDFRMLSDDGALSCFCPAHLEAFGQHSGERITREALAERLTRPGQPDPIRAAWLDFQGDVMVEVCRQVEQVVHKQSPETRLGLMCSWSTDGRWWDAGVRALAGPLRPLARPSLAPYGEGRATGFLPDKGDLLKEVACLPSDTEICPELENWGYTPFHKSARMNRLQIVLSQVLGHAGITMNIFDLVGSPTSEDPRMAALPGPLKPVIDAIASVAGPGGTPRGVAVPFRKRYADFNHAEHGAYRFDGESWSAPLQGSGVPIVMDEDRPITAVSGQSLRAFSADQVKRVLRGGLLVDATAAAVLHDLGFGAQLGVEMGESLTRYDSRVTAERDDWQTGQAPGDQSYTSLVTIFGTGTLIYPLTLADGARQVSTLVNLDRHDVLPGMVLYENELGGRVATYSFDLSGAVGDNFMSWFRRRQLQRVIQWLGRDRVDLMVDGGAWMMPVRRDYADYLFLAVLNFETDAWQEIILTFDWDARPGKPQFEVLDSAGAFRPMEPTSLARRGPMITARFAMPVAALDFAVFRVVE